MYDLREHLLSVLGNYDPEKHIKKGQEYSVAEETVYDELRLKKILISVDKDDLVPAYILEPLEVKNSTPAILCLHQTTVDSSLGAKEVIGKGGKSNYHYAFELAKLGYVTISPDYPLFGEYNISLNKIYSDYGYESITMKAIVNHISAVNILLDIPYVDNSRIGCIGHSLGGTNALFSTYFDSRIKATVVSAGFTTFEKYAKSSPTGDLSRWALKEKYMPNVESKYRCDYRLMPFDFKDLLASLCDNPLFISIPKQDEIFDFDGAIECVEYAIESCSLLKNENNFKFLTPDVTHDFPKNVRDKAYDFFFKTLLK